MSVRTPRSLRRIAAAAAAVLLATAALSGCESAVNTSGSGTSDGSPQKGGTIQVGTAVDLVPAAIFTNSNDTINMVIGQVFDSLIDYPIDSLEPQPRLAESWEPGKDGQSLTLDLRDDVKFHDGAGLHLRRTWSSASAPGPTPSGRSSSSARPPRSPASTPPTRTGSC